MSRRVNIPAANGADFAASACTAPNDAVQDFAPAQLPGNARTPSKAASSQANGHAQIHASEKSAAIPNAAPPVDPENP